jgi:hypothetical protein
MLYQNVALLISYLMVFFRYISELFCAACLWRATLNMVTRKFSNFFYSFYSHICSIIMNRGNFTVQNHDSYGADMAVEAIKKI